MSAVRKALQDPRQRRKLASLASGALILLGLAAGRLAGQKALGDGLMVAAALAAGWDIALRAALSLRRRQASIELLVTIAAAGALAIGEYWEAAAVTFLFIFGAYLEARTLSRTRQVLGELLDLAPVTAVVLRNGRQVEVLAHEVQPGEVALVKPGARIAVDGEVLEGRSAVDESAITGEPMPEEKGPGAPVYAGSVNQHGLLQVRTAGAGADTTLARIIRRVEEAQEEKAPTQRFVERFARWYTPLVIALSGAAFLIWRNVELSLTLLVIGCPGALVISTPVSVVAGIGRAARAGILIKGGEYLENSGKISALALDKTGTLTEGRPRLGEVLALQEALPSPVLALPSQVPSALLAGEPLAPAGPSNGREGGPPAPGDRWNPAQREVLRWAIVAETGSEHPLARAIMAEAAEAFPGEIPQAESFQALAGQGALASYQGHRLAVGTAGLMQELGIGLDERTSRALAELKSQGKTAVLVSLDKRVVGILGIADRMRESAPAMVRRLRSAGLKRLLMLTGDDRLTAQAIADQAGIGEVHADLLPEDKLAVIRRLQAEGHVVAMAGDGINDAPALAAADIGLAMGAAGSGLAIETADIALMSDDLTRIAEAIRLSRATLRNVRQNVAIALVTVSALLVGVLLGEVHMAGGMLIHQASVLIVILNGMRLMKA